MAAARHFFSVMRSAFLRKERFVAVDPGTHALKAVQLHPIADGVQILREKRIPLYDDGVIDPAEIRENLQATLSQFGGGPIAFSLPQDLAISQVIDLPVAPESEIARLIEEETVKLSGISESAIAFDYAPLEPFGKYEHPYWITICREEEIQEQLTRYGLTYDDVCGITTSANALLAAFLRDAHRPESAVLTDLGATRTTVVIVHQGQGVYAGTFPVGGDTFTAALARELDVRIEEAENRKRTENYLGEEHGLPGFRETVDQWYGELDRIIAEWFRENEEFREAEQHYPVVLSASGSFVPGMFEYLSENSVRRIHRWYVDEESSCGLLDEQFAIAYGAGLQAVGSSPQSVSLLPSGLKEAWGEERSRQWMQTASLVCVVLVALVMVFATWKKLDHLRVKNQRLATLREQLVLAGDLQEAEGETRDVYRRLRSVLERQRETLDTLGALEAIGAAAAEDYWYVLFADQETYFSHGIAQATNTTAASSAPEFVPPAPKYGFIAETCVPADGDQMRIAVGQLVSELNANPLFRKVDSLAPDQRRFLVEPSVVITNHHFAFILNLEKNPFSKTVPASESASKPPRDDSGESRRKTFRTMKRDEEVDHPEDER